MYLTFDDKWVDLYTTVVNGNIFEDLDLTSLGVNLEYAHVGTEWP